MSVEVGIGAGVKTGTGLGAGIIGMAKFVLVEICKAESHKRFWQ